MRHHCRESNRSSRSITQGTSLLTSSVVIVDADVDVDVVTNSRKFPGPGIIECSLIVAVGCPKR